MLSEFEKGLLTQQMRDTDRCALSLVLFAGSALFALLLVISTSRAKILSATRVWVLGFFNYRMAWNPRWILLLAIIGATIELISVVRCRKATRTLDLDYLEKLALSDPAAFDKLAKQMKNSN